MSPVNLGTPWNAMQCAPTTRYSTPWEFNNAINSLKSFCSFITVAPSDQLQQYVHSLVARERAVKLPIGFICFLKGAEFSHDLLHIAESIVLGLLLRVKARLRLTIPLSWGKSRANIEE